MNIPSRRCSYAFCTKQHSFNVEGNKTAAFCKQHAKDGMVNVYSRCCSYDSYSKEPSFNVEGCKAAAYFK